MPSSASNDQQIASFQHRKIEFLQNEDGACQLFNTSLHAKFVIHSLLNFLDLLQFMFKMMFSNYANLGKGLIYTVLRYFLCISTKFTKYISHTRTYIHTFIHIQIKLNIHGYIVLRTHTTAGHQSWALSVFFNFFT